MVDGGSSDIQALEVLVSFCFIPLTDIVVIAGRGIRGLLFSAHDAPCLGGPKDKGDCLTPGKIIVYDEFWGFSVFTAIVHFGGVGGVWYGGHITEFYA